jgi:hypothetical protein
LLRFARNDRLLPQERVAEGVVANRINRAIELLAQDQAIYYVGAHSGHVLTRAQGREDAGTWADYINIGMEHGAFDMTGLAEYMAGLVEGGPTRSGHRAPAVIVEAPVNGIDEANVRYNAWQFRQILGRGVHGVLLCQAETEGAARAFVEACRYPHQKLALDPSLPGPIDRMRGAVAATPSALGLLGVGTRGRGSEATAAAIWGISEADYRDRCDPWPLNPDGEGQLLSLSQLMSKRRSNFLARRSSQTYVVPLISTTVPRPILRGQATASRRPQIFAPEAATHGVWSVCPESVL